MPPKGCKNKSDALDDDTLLAEAIASNQAVAGSLAAQRLQAETAQKEGQREVRMCCAFPDCQKEKDNADKWCGGCKCVKYCDAACQGAHWKAHKAICKLRAAKDAGSDMSQAKNTVVDGVGPVNDRLWEACKVGRLSDVERLIVEGGDVNTTNVVGATCLGAACNGGHVAVAALLLIRGALVNQVANNGLGPLFAAAAIGNEPMVSLLLDKGALVDAAIKEHGITPLGMAAKMGHAAVVKRLLLAGADPLHRATDGKTPLDYAIQEKRPEVVVLLEAHPPPPSP